MILVLVFYISFISLAVACLFTIYHSCSNSAVLLILFL